jgi:hypothetical protein
VIRVKKPFEPDNTQSNEAKPLAEVVSTYMEVHPEHEEKPLAPYTTSTSEDYHGGEELTFSFPSQASPQPTSDNSQDTQQVQSYSSSQYDEFTQQDSLENDSKTASDNGSAQEPGIADTSVDTETEPGDESITSSDESGRDSKQESVDPGGSNNTQGAEETEANGEEDQTQSRVYNTQQAFDIISNTDFNVKYYQTEFYRFLEMVAEEKTKVYDPVNAEEYNVKKLMFRPYEKKPLNYYKMSRVRDTVVLILDNSGSMAWWSRNIQILAGLAMERNDVELYIAPNGYIKQAVHRGQFISVSHSEVVKRLQGRKIIYVGDFDGANTAIELSWYNDVIWVCPESRYKHFLQHDWVHYDESQFKGAFVRVFTLEEIFGVFKRVLSNPRVWIDLCGEKYECGVYS